MRKISLIGAASGWGAGFRATEDGPGALRDLGLARWLNDADIAAAWDAMIEPARRWRGSPAPDRCEVFRLVAAHNADLAAAVSGALAKRHLPVVLGGDHAGAIGTWGGVASNLALDESPWHERGGPARPRRAFFSSDRRQRRAAGTSLLYRRALL